MPTLLLRTCLYTQDVFLLSTSHSPPHESFPLFTHDNLRHTHPHSAGEARRGHCRRPAVASALGDQGHDVAEHAGACLSVPLATQPSLEDTARTTFLRTSSACSAI